MLLKAIFMPDFSFGKGIELVGGAGTCYVKQIVEQEDGKIILIGNFNRYNDIVVPPLIRILQDGSLDSTFNFYDTNVEIIGLQSSGKIIYSDGSTIKRLNTDGSLDNSFSLIEPTCTVSIANPCVLTITAHGMQTNDVAPFRFRTTGSLPTGLSVNTLYYVRCTGANTFYIYNNLANAAAGGSTGRIATSGSQSGVHSQRIEGYCQNFCVHKDDNITAYFQGNGSTLPSLFYTCGVNGSVVSKMARALVNSYPDVYKMIESTSESYSASGDNFILLSMFVIGGYRIEGVLTNNIFYSTGAPHFNNSVLDMVNVENEIGLNEDSFYVVGEFTDCDSSTQLRLGKQRVGFHLDTWLGTTGFNATATCIAVNNTNDKLYIGGDFTSFKGIATKGLVRINVSDASLDSGFNISGTFNNSPNVVKVLSNNRIIVGGSFTSVGGVTQNRVCLFNEYGNLIS